MGYPACREVIGAADIFVGVNAVDYSVAGDTRVWIRKCGGGARLVKIADIVAMPADEYETLAVDPESLKISWQRIIGRHAHKVVGKKCFRVRLERGQQIEITEDHSLYTIENNRIVAVPGRMRVVGNRNCGLSSYRYFVPKSSALIANHQSSKLRAT